MCVLYVMCGASKNKHFLGNIKKNILEGLGEKIYSTENFNNQSINIIGTVSKWSLTVAWCFFFRSV